MFADQGKKALLRVKIFFITFFRGSFFSDRFIKYSMILAFLINIVLWVIILIKIQGQAKPLPLHFNAFYGIELVGSGFSFLKLALIGLLLLFINFWLAGRLFLKASFLSYCLASTTALLQALLLIAGINILVINL